MLIHLDTSVLVDAFTGHRRSLAALRTATARGDSISVSTIVLYEWLRGPRTEVEASAVAAFLAGDSPAAFGAREAERAAELYRSVQGARRRQADLAIAACAIRHGASLWTLNLDDFTDVPGLSLYRATGVRQ
jgi:predicted nucleic acid-binding protein